MANKFYRTTKASFLWDEGIIIENSAVSGGKVIGYKPVDNVFENKYVPCEYVSSEIVENNPEWFEEVYPVSFLTKTVYKGIDEAKESIKKMYRS